MAISPSEWTLPRLRIDRNGDWFDDGVQITHHGVLANLQANLRRDPGGYYLQTRVRIPVEVDDVPWVITRLERLGDELRARVNDGSEETVDPAHLRIGPGHVPYCTVKGGVFEARFGRAAAYQLLSLADYDEATGRGTLRLGDRAYPLEPAPAPPG